MTKNQFLRLTLVLVIPFMAASWWWSEQEYIIKQGQLITCDVENGTCRGLFDFPKSEYSEINSSSFSLQHKLSDGKNIIFLENFSLPISTAYLDPEKAAYVQDETMDAAKFARSNCYISGVYAFMYSCSSDYVSIDKNSGNLSFKNQEDGQKYVALINLAKKELKKSDTYRIWFAVAFFFVLLLAYLILALLIRFVLHGFKPLDQKKPLD